MRKYKTIKPINELSEAEKEIRENTIEKYTVLDSKLESIMFFQCIITTIVAVFLAVFGFYIAKDYGNVEVFIISLIIIAGVGLITPPMENLNKRLILFFMKTTAEEYEQLETDCRKYTTQKSIERFFLQLLDTQKETVSLDICIDYKCMMAEWKYADIDTGNVKTEREEWEVLEIAENNKIDTPAIDIKNLSILVPLQRKEEEE